MLLIVNLNKAALNVFEYFFWRNHSFPCINTMKSLKCINESLLFSFNVWFQHVKNHSVCLGYSAFRRVSSGKVPNHEVLFIHKMCDYCCLSKNVAEVVCGIISVINK